MDMPEGIKKEIENTRALHTRAFSDYKQCVEFNKLMSDLLARLEDEGYSRGRPGDDNSSGL